MVNPVHYNTVEINTILDSAMGKKRDLVWKTLTITRNSSVTYLFFFILK